ncbi:Fat storage-inducing transmembrane protein [Gongronella butleri]|nr:Fat storage-inducing transmembrane protein [Gongronella butleri]
MPQLLQPHQKTAVALYVLSVVVAFAYSAVFSPPPSYFSNKRNIFNVVFVKQGWAWITLVYGAYSALVLSKRWTSKQQMQSLARFLCVTLYWFIMTQWLFGPSFIDRVYVLTGGGCHPLDGVLTTLQQKDTLAQIFTQGHCRRMGGAWQGGHDVSGHCVMLIHASLMFWEELSWLFYNIPGYTSLKTNTTNAWRAVNAVLGLLLVSWWMLVMTAVYFHGHFELFTGCLFAVLGWAALYLGLFPNVEQIGLPPRTL